MFDLHFFGPAALARAALPHMRRQRSGAIVQMSSVGGQVTAPGFGAYCATKFALEGLTETLSQEVDFGVPLRLALGADAVDGIRGRLTSLSEELGAWEAVSRDTAVDEVTSRP